MASGILPFALRAVPLRGTFKIVPDNFSRTTEGVSQQIYSLPRWPLGYPSNKERVLCGPGLELSTPISGVMGHFSEGLSAVRR